MRNNKLTVLFPIGFIMTVLVEFSFAQQPTVEQTFTYNQKELWFDRVVSLQNTNLINGPEYFIPFQAATTHPFFGSRELSNEQLRYDGQLYTDIPLLYDIFSDILILRIQDKNSLFAMVQIDKTKVESFTLYHHAFKKMSNPKSSEAGEAYYEILFEGKNMTLVAKRGKTNYIRDGKAEYETDDKFYFIRQHEWVRLTGNSSYYELMKSNKPKITNFIKANKFKVRKNNEQDMIAIATFCDSLEETVMNQ